MSMSNACLIQAVPPQEVLHSVRFVLCKHIIALTNMRCHFVWVDGAAFPNWKDSRYLFCLLRDGLRTLLFFFPGNWIWAVYLVFLLHWFQVLFLWRCVLVSYDDGTLRMVSLSRAAYDVPVTGEPFTGTLQQGVHSYCCSSSAIWSIHVSRLTGCILVYIAHLSV